MARVPEVLILNAELEDAPAEQVAVLLEGAGFHVRLGGNAADPMRGEEVAAALGRARVVVVIWSAGALDSPGLLAAADIAHNTDRLVSLTDGGAPATSRPPHLRARTLPHWRDRQTVLERVGLAAARRPVPWHAALQALRWVLPAVGAALMALTLFAELSAGLRLAPWAEALGSGWRGAQSELAGALGAAVGSPWLGEVSGALGMSLGLTALVAGVWLRHPGFRPGLEFSGRVFLRTLFLFPAVLVTIFAAYRYGGTAAGGTTSAAPVSEVVAFLLLYAVMIAICLPVALIASVRPENRRSGHWAAAVVALGLAVSSLAAMPGPGPLNLLDWVFAPGSDPGRLPALVGLVVILPFAILTAPTRALLRAVVGSVGLGAGLLLASEMTRALDPSDRPVRQMSTPEGVPVARLVTHLPAPGSDF